MMFKFTKLDKTIEFDAICLHGEHDYKIPFLSILLITNHSLFSSANGDSFFLTKIKTKANWSCYVWFYDKLIKNRWCHKEEFENLLMCLLGKTNIYSKSKVYLRVEHSGNFLLVIRGYHENLGLAKKLLNEGVFLEQRKMKK